ncbi:hypothetical protein PHLCEN_2v3281 [Hermanssonia centrifuga]|uniref:Polyketide synthase-like phosphopantetheine-binding domain-containing protein n=1 Tax=Hermanssonia centrifuga TaxID=98765 RepID=A0A2R6QUH1_9APHY|nr:hypothetical protein PHLCEN_2v3281 [Hermanssonia centrifuga]
MPLPNTQALSSKTFTAARHVLEDSTSTLLDLYEWNATHNPDHPLFCFHDGTRVRTILWREATLAIYRAAIYFTSQARAVLGSGATGYPQVVAVLASTENPGTDWDYLEMSTQLKPEFIPYGDGIYELVLIADDTWKPAIINTKVGNFDAYATRDLFISHETKPNLWKIYGRADDQIMLSTGEKDGLDFESLEVDKSEQFKCTVWPTIERMNAFAPQHSRIFKEMIIVASPSIPFTYTAKGTARRQAIIADYEAEINNLYATLGGNVQAASAIPKPCTWVYEETLPYIRHIVRSTLTRDVNDDVDIFRYGCDSLQAMWIRNRILHALQETSNASTNLSPNCVFDAPSVAALAKYVSDVVASVTHVHSSVEHHVALLQAFVSKYTSGFLSRPPSLHDRPKSRDIILLTGSTGGFGCHILADLLTDSSVDKVYALNRKPGDLQRQSAAMHKQGLDETLLNSPKLCFLESDLQDVMLGLDRSKYEEIRTSLTHIIHNAWKVDFNHNVASFDEILASVRNLVNLALSSPYTEPPHLLFTSSIGVFRQTQTKDYLLEEHNRDPNVVVGIGYTEAKWVAERILEEAQHKTGLRTTVVRLGQLCGARNGYWNEREWFPAVVQSAEYLHCLPDVEGAGTISWIPSAEASKALLEMRNTHEEVLHLVHPHPIPWRTFMDPISTLLRVPLVPYATWLAKLEAAALYAQDRRIDEMQGMHALRLLDFFRNVDQSDRKEPLGVARLSVAKALLEAPSLSIMSGLDTGWAARWIKSWKEIGLLHDWRAADCYL